MRNGRRSISPIVSILLLIVIVVVAAVVAYGLIMGFIPQVAPSTPESTEKRFVLEGYSRNGRLLTLYVRNVGESTVIVSSIYIDTLQRSGAEKLDFAKIESSTEIWGGDIWTVNPNNLRVERTVEGKILYDDFTSQDPTTWDDDYVDSNNDWSNVYYDSDGLKLLSDSSGGWAARGLITQSKIINLQQLPVVIEVDLQKTNYNIPWWFDYDAAGSPFAACLYLSAFKNSNPYFANPWFAVKLYPRAFPSRTEAQLVARDSSGINRWEVLDTFYSSPNSQPRGIFLLVFNESDKVYCYYWRNSRSGLPDNTSVWTSTGLSEVFSSGDLYVYVTIDNTVTYTRKVHVRYLEIYRGTEITVEGLSSGWVVQLNDSSGTIFEGKATGGSLTIDLLGYILERGMPITNGKITVFTYDPDELEAYGGIVIPPKTVKPIVVDVGSRNGYYVISIVDKSGAKVSQTIEL